MGEDQNTEYKQSWEDDHLKWICGFANAHGGKLYIGCDDDGKVVGVKEDVKRLAENISSKIKSTMQINADVILLNEDGKDYIEIDVAPYSDGICFNGGFYRRVGATNRLLSGPDLKSFLLKTSNQTMDAQPIADFTLDDIDDSALEYFKKLAAKKGYVNPEVLNEPKDVLLDKLGLIEDSKLTYAAMLLFGKDPDKWLSGAYVKVGFFESDTELVFNDEIHGPIIEQIDKVIDLVYQKYLRAKITYEGMVRNERYFIPREAFREALINAICHKRYESCAAVQISVYDDKLYINNCAYLPDDFNIESIMLKHRSIPYNPKIANVFRYAGFIENWGLGIEKISSVCKADGIYQPTYFITSMQFMIEFTAPEDRLVRLAPSNPADRRGYHLDEVSQKLISLIAENPLYNYDDLAEKVSMGRTAIYKRLKELREKGIIKRIGSDKNGYWEIIKEL